MEGATRRWSVSQKSARGRSAAADTAQTRLPPRLARPVSSGTLRSPLAADLMLRTAGASVCPVARYSFRARAPSTAAPACLQPRAGRADIAAFASMRASTFASAAVPDVKEEYIQLANQLAEAAAEITTKVRASIITAQDVPLVSLAPEQPVPNLLSAAAAWIACSACTLVSNVNCMPSWMKAGACTALCAPCRTTEVALPSRCRSSLGPPSRSISKPTPARSRCAHRTILDSWYARGERSRTNAGRSGKAW